MRQELVAASVMTGLVMGTVYVVSITSNAAKFGTVATFTITPSAWLSMFASTLVMASALRAVRAPALRLTARLALFPRWRMAAIFAGLMLLVGVFVYLPLAGGPSFATLASIAICTALAAIAGAISVTFFARPPST